MWRWLLPPALCALFLGAFFAYRHFSRTPQELCTYAMKNAFSYGVGYDAPVGSAMDLRGLKERLQTGRVQLRWDLQLEETNLEWKDTPLAELTDVNNLPDLSLLSGVGIRMETGIYQEEAIRHRLYVSYGALRFQLLELFVSEEQLAIAAPELSGHVLTAAPQELLGDWELLPEWEWLDDFLRESVWNGLELAEQAVASLRERLNTGKQVFNTFYDTTGEFLEELLSSFSYEKLAKEDDDATRRFYVRGEKQLCQGYSMTVDGTRLTESVGQAFGLPLDSFRLEGEDGGEIVFRLYLTKKAELASLSGGFWLWLGDTCWPIHLEAEFSGKENAADSFWLTVAVGEQEEAVFTFEKKAERDGMDVDTRLSAELRLAEDAWSVNGTYALTDSGSRLSAEFTLQENAEDKGSVSFAAVCASADDVWELSLRKLCFTDSEGRYLSVNTALEALSLSEAPQPPEGTAHGLFSLTQDEWEQIKEELSENIKKYLELIDRLF